MTIAGSASNCRATHAITMACGHPLPCLRRKFVPRKFEAIATRSCHQDPRSSGSAETGAQIAPVPTLALINRGNAPAWHSGRATRSSTHVERRQTSARYSAPRLSKEEGAPTLALTLKAHIARQISCMEGMCALKGHMASVLARSSTQLPAKMGVFFSAWG